MTTPQSTSSPSTPCRDVGDAADDAFDGVTWFNNDAEEDEEDDEEAEDEDDKKEAEDDKKEAEDGVEEMVKLSATMSSPPPTPASDEELDKFEDDVDVDDGEGKSGRMLVDNGRAVATGSWSDINGRGGGGREGGGGGRGGGVDDEDIDDFGDAEDVEFSPKRQEML